MQSPTMEGSRRKGELVNIDKHRDESERGAATAEYAIATVAAAGFAGLLAAILQSAAVKDMVTGLITQALAFVL